MACIKKASTEVEAVVPGIKNGSGDQDQNPQRGLGLAFQPRNYGRPPAITFYINDKCIFSLNIMYFYGRPMYFSACSAVPAGQF